VLGGWICEPESHGLLGCGICEPRSLRCWVVEFANQRVPTVLGGWICELESTGFWVVESVNPEAYGLRLWNLRTGVVGFANRGVYAPGLWNLRTGEHRLLVVKICELGSFRLWNLRTQEPMFLGCGI
jgi:hypothetical protein